MAAPPGDGCRNDSGPGGDQGQPTVDATAKRLNNEDATGDRRQGHDGALYRRLDADYVRRSFRRSWEPEIRRLRRQLRGVTQ